MKNDNKGAKSNAISVKLGLKKAIHNRSDFPSMKSDIEKGWNKGNHLTKSETKSVSRHIDKDIRKTIRDFKHSK